MEETPLSTGHKKRAQQSDERTKLSTLAASTEQKPFVQKQNVMGDEMNMLPMNKQRMTQHTS